MQPIHLQALINVNVIFNSSLSPSLWSCRKVMFSVMSVCHSVHRSGFYWSVTSHMGPWVQAPQICSNLYTYTMPYRDTLDMFKLVHNVTRASVGKQVVGIQLKCLLVQAVKLTECALWCLWLVLGLTWIYYILKIGFIDPTWWTVIHGDYLCLLCNDHHGLRLNKYNL